MLFMILAVAAISAIVVVIANLAAGNEGRVQLDSAIARMPMPADRQAHYLQMALTDGRVHAVKAVRTDLGLRLADARDLVDLLTAGHHFPEA